MCQGARVIEELLSKAKDFIPKEEWPKTPLAVRATAGLRLLPSHQAQALLDEVSINLILCYIVIFDK